MKNRIRPYRMDRGWSSKQFAEMLKIEWQELLDIEQGKKDPSAKLIKKIVQTLEEPASDLFPELEVKNHVNYSNYDEELLNARRYLRILRFLVLNEKEPSTEYHETVVALDTALKLIRKERRMIKNGESVVVKRKSPPHGEQ